MWAQSKEASRTVQIARRGTARTIVPVDASFGLSTVRAIVSAVESRDGSADESAEELVGELLAVWLGDRDIVGIEEGAVDTEGCIDTVGAGVGGATPFSRNTGHSS